MVTIKSQHEIDIMRIAGKILSDTFKEVAQYIVPGVTTLKLNAIIEKFIRSRGAVPSCLNYNGFPAAICSSVNQQVVHGVPNDTKLSDGDIVSLDFCVYYQGYHVDSAKTFAVGNISKEAQRLIDVTRLSFYEGIKYARAGNRLHDISSAIQECAEENGYSVVRDLTGHGIGREMHEAPNVPNYGKAGTGLRLQKGMTIAVEPMINEGKHQVCTLNDGWTVVTADGSLSAHYEHTILITDVDPVILTL